MEAAFDGLLGKNGEDEDLLQAQNKVWSMDLLWVYHT